MTHYKYSISIIEEDTESETFIADSAKEGYKILCDNYSEKTLFGIATFYKYIKAGEGPFFTIQSLPKEKASRVMRDREYRKRRTQKLKDQAERIKELEEQLGL